MLTLWKRHSPTCKNTNEKVFKELSPDQHRLYRDCLCACWVTGIHPITNQMIKQSLKTTNWAAAEKLKLRLETSEETTVSAPEEKGITVEMALAKWMANKERIGVSNSTIDSMYSALSVCVLAFTKERGIIQLSDFDDATAFDLIESPRWRRWKMSTASRQLSNLRAFFNYAVARQWITRNPALGIDRPPTGSGKVTPFTPEEQDLLEDAFGNWTEKLRTSSGQWAMRPETLHCLKHVLADTGLRISDAQRIRPAMIEVWPSGDGECTLRQVKLDGFWGGDDSEVTVYLKQSTIEEMKRVPWCSQAYPFMLTPPIEEGEGFKRHLRGQGKTVYAAMKLVGKVAGVNDCRKHKFRHTFAVKMLINGWGLEKVYRFMGHKNTVITQKFYAKWTKNRQQMLREEVRSRWAQERAIPQVRKPRETEEGDARKVS
jgi:site-specific recombinase XerD